MRNEVNILRQKEAAHKKETNEMSETLQQQKSGSFPSF